MDIVPDEWLLEYMVPQSEYFSLSNRFLDEMERRSDRIVVRMPSAFTKKLFKFASLHQKRFTRFFKILYDLEKVLLVDNSEIKSLPDRVANSIPPDDLYIAELLYFTEERVFLTTDKTLCDILSAQGDVRAFLVMDFLKNYYKIL